MLGPQNWNYFMIHLLSVCQRIQTKPCSTFANKQVAVCMKKGRSKKNKKVSNCPLSYLDFSETSSALCAFCSCFRHGTQFLVVKLLSFYPRIKRCPVTCGFGQYKAWRPKLNCCPLRLVQNLIEHFVRMLVACLHVVFYLCHKSSTNFPPEANVQSFFFARGCLSLDVTKHAGLGQFRKSNALSVFNGLFISMCLLKSFASPYWVYTRADQ